MWNVITNAGSKLWSSILSVVAVPIFIRFLGAEAYGLIGLFTSLHVLFSFLDLGLSATVNREIAQNTANGRDFSENLVLVRTFETIYWVIAICIALLIFLGANLFATKWVNVQQLTSSEVQLAITIMAIAFAARWPISLYSSVLQGQQEQVLQNVIAVAATSFRMLGALVIVVCVSPTIKAFLLWQALSYLLEVSACTLVVWRGLKSKCDKPAYFDIKVLGRVWRFALGFNGVSVLYGIWTGGDKLIISKFLPIKQLGYYLVAWTVVGGMPLISYAIVDAMFPRFSGRSANGDNFGLFFEYRQSVQAISFLSVGVSLAITFFSFEILSFWIGDSEIANQTYIALSLLAIGNLFFAIQYVGYNLLVATGQTKIPLLVHTAIIVISLPMLFFSIPIWGIKAAAAICLLQNLVCLLVYSVCAQRTVCRDKTNFFLIRSLLPYLLLGCVWIGGARLFLYSTGSSLISFLAVLLFAEGGYFLSSLLLSRAIDIFPIGSSHLSVAPKPT